MAKFLVTLEKKIYSDVVIDAVNGLDAMKRAEWSYDNEYGLIEKVIDFMAIDDVKSCPVVEVKFR